MNEESIFTVLQSPHVSEKAAMSSNGYRQYVFKVAPEANKIDVRAAVEKLFKVSVRNVRICNVKGKRKKFGRIQGRQKDWKKAYVTLDRDQELDIAGQAA